MQPDYQIKQKPEDFLVRELSILKLDDGDYTYFELHKRNHTTIEAVELIAKALHIKPKDLGYAGMKDKKAVTWQLCSVKDVSKERIESLKFSDIEITYVGKGKEPMNLGELQGNEFEIVVRNVENDFNVKPCVPNYFGEQRFSENNYIIGRFILKKDFKQATDLMDHKSVKEYLEQNPTDYIGAIRTLPTKLIKIYINAVQSYLWNVCVIQYLKKFKHVDLEDSQFNTLTFPTEKVENQKIPLVSFENEYENKEVEDIYSKIMHKEEISERDFIIREIPQLTPEGGERDLLQNVSELQISEADDELNQGKKKLKVEFRLSKGSYATVFIRSLFC